MITLDKVDWNLLESFLHIENDSEIVKFFKQFPSGLNEVLKSWEFFITQRDQTQYVLISKKLAFVVTRCNVILHQDTEDLTVKLAITESRPILQAYYEDLIQNFIHVFFTALKVNNRSNITNPIIALLQGVVDFKDDSLINDFVSAFDFNSSITHLVFVSRNRSVRRNFMCFWMSLNSAVSSYTRKDLLSNTKIMNNFWREIEWDDFETYDKIFDFIKNQICLDANLKKATKCKLLGDNSLAKLAIISLKLDSPEYTQEIKDKCRDLLLLLGTDAVHGIVYPKSSGSGVPITVNNKDFKIQNKLLYNLLTMLKPWDSMNNLNVCVSIMETSPELVGPFANWIVAHGGGYHEPALTSWWVSRTLLYNRILKIPGLNEVSHEAVSLAPLSRAALTKCLESKKGMINQLALQLVCLQLDQLQTKGTKQETLDAVINNLPPLSFITNFLDHENRIIKLTSLMIVRKYEYLKSGTQPSLFNLVNVKISEFDQFDKFKLILLDNYLSIQSNNEDFKWFNKSGKHSFFTNLIELSKIDAMKHKAYQILCKITHDSLIFNKNLIETPVLPLVNLSSKMTEPILNVLDETIARVAKVPYKYLDLSHTEYDDISLFVVALFEQIKFAEQTDAVKDWLNDFAQQLVIIGEPEKLVRKLLGSRPVIKVDTKKVPKSKFEFGQFLYALRSAEKEKEIINIFTNMGNFALTDNSVHEFVLSEKFWRPFFEIDGKSESQVLKVHLLNELLQQMPENVFNTSFNTFVVDSLQESSLDVMKIFSWVLKDDQLVELSGCYDINPVCLFSVYQEILNRKIKINPDFERLLDVKDFDKLLVNFDVPLNIIARDVKKYGFLLKDKENSDFQEFEDTSDPEILYLLGSKSKKFAHLHHKELIPLALSFANWSQSLKVLRNLIEYADVKVWTQKVFDQVSSENMKMSFLTEFIDLVLKLPPSERLNEWGQRAMLYITKKLAESPELSPKFEDFWQQFHTIKKDIHIPLSVVNAQLEVILGHKNWVQNEKYLAHAKELIQSKSINFEKLLQIFINNENNVLFKLPEVQSKDARIESSMIIKKFFDLNPPKNASEVLLMKILDFYLGSIREEDLILKSILISIEKSISVSWVSKISNWDFQEQLSEEDLELIGNHERLFIKDGSKLVMSLNKNFINNSINDAASELNVSYNYNDTVYDAEFILMTIVNNEDFVTEVTDDEGVKYKFNLMRLVESNLLAYVIVSLSNKNTVVSQIAKLLISGVVKSLEEFDMKDKNVWRVYLSNILNTLRKDHESFCVIWYSYSCLIPILNNPNHFLYEKTCKYLLSHPVISEVPLLKLILSPSIEKDITNSIHEQYYKQLNWLISRLTYGTKTQEDLKIVRSQRIIESVMNLYNSFYVSDRLKQSILRFIYTIQGIVSGSDLLATRFSGLSNLEIIKQKLRTEGLLDETKLNMSQISIRFGLAFKDNKRIAEWTSDDVLNSVKRVHT